MERIVSLVPSITEMLFAAGAGGQVVGVTNWCTYPPEAASREKIGGLQPDIEKILFLRPDAVFTRSSMTRSTLKGLETYGIRVVAVDAESFEEIAAELRRIGELTGHPEEGERAARDVEGRVRAVEARVKGKPAPAVYLELTSEPIGSAGPDSYTGDLIRRAGGRNILPPLGAPWRAVSWEVVLENDPDVILVAHKQTKGMEDRPGWSGLKAVRTRRVHHVPVEEFNRPTPRLVLGLERAARLIHETP
jgi:iron complex transport system substrate-binding protein